MRGQHCHRPLLPLRSPFKLSPSVLDAHVRPRRESSGNNAPRRPVSVVLLVQQFVLGVSPGPIHNVWTQIVFPPISTLSRISRPHFTGNSRPIARTEFRHKDSELFIIFGLEFNPLLSCFAQQTAGPFRSHTLLAVCDVTWAPLSIFVSIFDKLSGLGRIEANFQKIRASSF